MRRSLAVTLVVIGVLLSLSATTGVVAADRTGPDAQAPPLNETATDSSVTTASTTPPRVTYVVHTTSTEAIDTDRLAAYGTVGVQTGTYVEVQTAPNNRSAIETIPWVDSVRPAVRPDQQDVPGSSNGTSLGVEQAHSAGITGEGITVGVIDSGFDASNAEIASNVVATRSFTPSSNDPAHGTSVAEIVTRTAPDSDLYLASISNDVQTVRAIEYLTDQNVDVIVMSGGFAGYDDDGDHLFTEAVSQAQSEGILFVTSAGNYAQTHWEGDFRTTDGDAVHEWTADGGERNCIPNCQSPFSGTVGIYLKWTDTGQPSEYGMGLYNPETDQYVATQTSVRSTGTNDYVYLEATLDQQPIDLVVSHTDGTADDEIEVLVTDGASSIEERIPESSTVAPADVPAAFTVAAYDVGARGIAPYSSRGPTDDGRLGIDAAGYTNIYVNNGLYGQQPFVFSGTSAAAPYVAGVAALTTAESGAIPARSVADTLRSSSDDILDPGSDSVSGAGVINATAAANVTDASTDPETLALSVTPMTITANESTAVTITVTDAETTDPVEGASVSVTELGLTDTTNASGEAVLTAVPNRAGTYVVSASADGYVSTNATLTVTTPDTDGGSAESSLALRVTDAPESISPGSTFTVAYEVENGGVETTAYTLETSADTPNVTVAEFSGDVRSSVPGDTPASASTKSIDAGGVATVVITYNVTATTNGSTTITTTARDPLTGDNQTRSQTISIKSVPQDPTQRALQISGKQDAAMLTQDDVTAAITRFSRNESVNGIEVRQDDITVLITLFERN